MRDQLSRYCYCQFLHLGKIRYGKIKYFNDEKYNDGIYLEIKCKNRTCHVFYRTVDIHEKIKPLSKEEYLAATIMES